MQYLSEADMGIVLKVSRTTLWALRKEGLPFCKVRGQIRYRLNEVETWLENNCAGNRLSRNTTKQELSKNE
jgi:biotin operon repressor